jgi:indolepyruvate ferredoxin oxidoreductase beta subunit
MANKTANNVIFAGVGGQGNILVSHLLADAALASGIPVLLTETFGAATRGGSVSSCVRMGNASAPLMRKHTCQMIVGLEPLEGLRQALSNLMPGGWVLINERTWTPLDVSAGRTEYPSLERILEGFELLGGKVIHLDATGIAQELGNSRMMNIVLLGGLMALGEIEIENTVLLEQMDKRWKPEIAATNKRAFSRGYELVLNHIKTSDYYQGSQNAGA